MARRGENIRKRKDGRWEGRYPKGRRDGKPVQGSVYGRTYREAREKLARAKAALEEERRGRDGLAAGREGAASETFSAAAAEWLEAKAPTVKRSSLSCYRGILDRHLLPEFGSMRVTEIAREDVAAFSTRLLSRGGASGKSLSPKTVSDILSVLKGVMGHFRRTKCAPTMDFDGLSVRQPQKRTRIFSRVEQEKLTKCLQDGTTPVKLGILLCLYMGLRVGEICGLKWGDVSLAERKIHVARTLQRIREPDGKGHRTQIVITPPKSDCSERDIPIPDGILGLLEEMRQPDDCFLLTGSRESFLEPRCMENHFGRVMRECGIEGATMHTCRHSFATRCVELGFDMKSLSEILGHASVSITLNRYVHPTMELKQANMGRLSALLGVREAGRGEGDAG